MRSVTELTPADFMVGHKLMLGHGGKLDTIVERFVVTCIGSIAYAVSMDYGYAYTRPQFIATYSKVNAVVDVLTSK